MSVSESHPPTRNAGTVAASSTPGMTALVFGLVRVAEAGWACIVARHRRHPTRQQETLA